jgi:hypothetical protein
MVAKTTQKAKDVYLHSIEQLRAFSFNVQECRWSQLIREYEGGEAARAQVIAVPSPSVGERAQGHRWTSLLALLVPVAVGLWDVRHMSFQGRWSAWDERLCGAGEGAAVGHQALPGNGRLDTPLQVLRDGRPCSARGQQWEDRDWDLHGPR